jgi:N-methylhydantoinase A/oxoprolinase/acetone carboxylase beta subunit
VEQLRVGFVLRYLRLYGHGAALRGARLEMVTFRCRSSAASIKPKLSATTTLSNAIAADARTGSREIYWAEWKRMSPTPILDGYKLVPGNAIVGPCVVETATTSVVVHPGQRIEVDSFGNFVIDPNYA